MSSSSRKLQVVSPVPADIDIANSVEPLHISQIAKDLNIDPLHYDLYGKYKAKVIIISLFYFPHIHMNLTVSRLLSVWDCDMF